MGGRRDIQARFPARLCLCLVLGGGVGTQVPARAHVTLGVRVRALPASPLR